MSILLSSLQPSYSAVPQAESNVNISLFGANLTISYIDCKGNGATAERVNRGYQTYLCVQALSEISFRDENNQPVKLTPGDFMPLSGKIYINCYRGEGRPLGCNYVKQK